MNHTDPVAIAPACAHRAAPMRGPATLLLALCLSLGPAAQLAAQTPTITSESLITSGNAGYAKADDTLTLTFIVPEGGAGLPLPPVIIAGQTASVSETTEELPLGVRYTATYTVMGGDTQGPVTYDIGTVTSASLSGETLDPPAATSGIIIDTVAPTFTFSTEGTTISLVLTMSDANLLESEVIELTDISYQASGVGAFMALPTDTSIATVNNLSVLCVFGTAGSTCEPTDPDTIDDYNGVGFNDVYRLQAAAFTDAAGNPNAETSQIPRPPQKPNKPQNLMAEAGDMQVTLTWEAAASNGSPITGYEYRVDDGSWMPVSPATALTDTVTGLANDREYRFRVRAVNIVGDSASSSSVFSMPVSPAPPPQARDIVSITVTARPRTVILDVGWQQGPATDRVTTTAFEVQYRVEGDPDEDASYINTNVVVGDFPMQTAVITDLQLNTPYVVRVRARADSLEGVWFPDPGRAVTDTRLNQAPTVTIAAPVLSVTSGASVMLSGNAIDRDEVGFGASRAFGWTQTSGTGGTLGESTSTSNTPG